MSQEKLREEDLLPEPVRPEAWECCGSDCGEACIQTIYWAEKARYDAQQKQWQAQLSAEVAARDVVDEGGADD